MTGPECKKTAFGDNSTKTERKLVASLGLDGLFANRDHVVGGAAGTRLSALVNRILPEQVKARRFAKLSRERK